MEGEIIKVISVLKYKTKGFLHQYQAKSRQMGFQHTQTKNSLLIPP